MVKLVKKLSDKGFPVHSKRYPAAHEKADKVEKKAYPKSYEKLKKAERKLGKHELMGKHTKSNKIEVEHKFKHNAKEIALHETVERKAMRKHK